MDRLGHVLWAIELELEADDGAAVDVDSTRFFREPDPPL